jgi:hypothetical protein
MKSESILSRFSKCSSGAVLLAWSELVQKMGMTEEASVSTKLKRWKTHKAPGIQAAFSQAIQILKRK